MAVRSIQIPDGVIDIIYSPDDGGYYMRKYQFSLKIDVVSERTYPTAAAAESHYNTGKPRWKR